MKSAFVWALSGVTMLVSFGVLADEIISVADIPGGTKLILSHELRQGYLHQVFRLEASDGRRELFAASIDEKLTPLHQGASFAPYYAIGPAARFEDIVECVLVSDDSSLDVYKFDLKNFDASTFVTFYRHWGYPKIQFLDKERLRAVYDSGSEAVYQWNSTRGMELISGHADDPLRQGPANLVNAARERERIERLNRGKEKSGASKEGLRDSSETVSSRDSDPQSAAAAASATGPGTADSTKQSQSKDAQSQPGPGMLKLAGYIGGSVALLAAIAWLAVRRARTRDLQ